MWYKILAQWLVIIASFAAVLPTPVFASIDSCTATVSPSAVTVSTSTSVNVSVQHNGSEGTITWVKIYRPSDKYTITGGSASGWSANVSSGDVTFTGGSIEQGNTTQFSISITTGSQTSGDENWTIEASDDGGGNTLGCGGSIGTSIEEPGFAVSDVGATNIAGESFTVTWTSNAEATSLVEYGTTTGYGSSQSDSTMKTSHSITLTGLSKSTTYHFKVTSVDADSNSASSGDNSVVTTSGPTATPTPTGRITGTPAPTATPTPVPDTVGPVTRITSSLEGAFVSAPTITFTASDPSFVTAMEYALDGGVRWTVLDGVPAGGIGKLSLSFALPPLFDDTYSLVLRATDGKGNKSTTTPIPLVIDRLPPRVGTSLFAVSQTPLPTGIGTVLTLSGIPFRVVMSTVGGPTEVHLVTAAGVTALTRQGTTGLWVGELPAPTIPGSYPLILTAIDGAKNKIEETVTEVVVLERGKVVDSKNQGISGATVTLLARDQLTNEWYIWDAAASGQNNPQQTLEDGSYGFFVPEGTYMMSIQAFAYHERNSHIIEVDTPSVVSDTISLVAARQWKLGPFILTWPSLHTTELVKISPRSIVTATANDPRIGTLFPEKIPLHTNTGQDSITSYRGKGILLTLLSTWHPQTAAQLKELESFKQKSDAHVLTLFPQETVSRIATIARLGQYTIPLFADPDGEFVTPLHIASVPSHLVIDAKGVIRATAVGLLDESELVTLWESAQEK